MVDWTIYEITDDLRVEPVGSAFIVNNVVLMVSSDGYDRIREVHELLLRGLKIHPIEPSDRKFKINDFLFVKQD